MSRGSRFLIDLLVVAVVVAALAAGAGRTAWHAAGFAADRIAGEPVSARTAIDRWWGPRELPHRGPDFLAVLERRGTLEAANEMVGALLLRHQRLGGTGSELIIPEDLGLMSDEVILLTLDRADGSQIVKEVQIFDEERIDRVSPLPVRSAAYAPALSPPSLAALPEPGIAASYPFGQARLFTPPSGSSGTFVLHTSGTRDTILLVPLEYSPLRRSTMGTP